MMDLGQRSIGRLGPPAGRHGSHGGMCSGLRAIPFQRLLLNLRLQALQQLSASRFMLTRQCGPLARDRFVFPAKRIHL